MLCLESTSITVGHINKSISYKTWKAILFPHPVQVRASAVCGFDRGESIEERWIRTLENMTYEKRLRVFPFKSTRDKTNRVQYESSIA